MYTQGRRRVRSVTRNKDLPPPRYWISLGIVEYAVYQERVRTDEMCSRERNILTVRAEYQLLNNNFTNNFRASNVRRNYSILNVINLS